jgi:uncharacterized protein YlxW (UPF0749 family)
MLVEVESQGSNHHLHNTGNVICIANYYLHSILLFTYNATTICVCDREKERRAAWYDGARAVVAAVSALVTCVFHTNTYTHAHNTHTHTCTRESARGGREEASEKESEREQESHLQCTVKSSENSVSINSRKSVP